MRTTPLAPFGVEVADLDLATCEGAALADLHAAICAHRVAVIRNQTLSDAAFAAWLQRLGESMFTEGETAVPGHPSLNVVTNVGRTRRPRSVFHTDTSYVERPPAFTALRAIDVPRSGGETEFTDQVALLDDLPARARDWLRGRRIRHAYTAPGLSEVASWHPAIRRHPDTDEAALYLSTPERCTRISDVDAATSARILSLLYRRSTRPSRRYRHRWRAGDVVIWDDRTTLHRADHSAVAGARTFHRGMVRGEVPVPA